MQNNEFLSLVIPVRNRSKLLRGFLTSIADKIPTDGGWEVLVCDDGSTEEIEKVTDRFRYIIPNLRILRQADNGPAAARNLGVKQSSAPIIIFLDSDVVPDRFMIPHLVAALEENPEWLGAEGRIEPSGEHKGPFWDAPTCQRGGRYHTAAIAYRREALIQAGGFDEEFKLPACEDVELAYRVLQQGPIRFVPEAIAYHPARRVSLRTHWQWRRHWKYEVILAKRYGFLSFPENPAGRFPRLRVAWAAMVTLPAGRLIKAIKKFHIRPYESLLASFYALFDVFCGIWALPAILFGSIPDRLHYLPKDPEIGHQTIRTEPPQGFTCRSIS